MGRFSKNSIQFAALSVLLAMLLSGCATIDAGPDRVSGGQDPLQPASEQVVGIVSFVDPAEEIALVEMRSPGMQTAQILLTRNQNLTETSRLEPTRFQRGRTLGTRIVSGLPNIGDEVLIP
ncbi:MAG TPA: hypothetical protein VK041_06545 [Opitutales bacterium]|nr:hypothetical protein [Opitutales bacterium]